MRQPTTSPLHALVAAVPPEALRAFVLEFLLNGAATGAPTASIATPAPRRAGRRGRPVGKPGGRPRKTAVTAATPDERKAARAARHAARKRERRAAERAARQAKAAEAIPATTNADVTAAVNGNGSPSTKKTEAARLWAHAAKIDAKSPWRPVANEFELNKQQTLDAYRLHTLPPGMTADAVERFLELPVE